MEIFKRRLKQPPRIIGIGNLKGGTGKSTLSVNLACAMAERGHRTVVIDTDPQKSTSLWAQGGLLPVGVAEFPLRDLTAAGEWLEELDILRARYSRVIIDLPAVVSPALASAFLVSDLIMIPSSISEVDVQATRRTLKHVSNTRRERAANPPKVMIVPSQVRPGWFNDGGVGEQLTALREPLSSPIRYDKKFGQAFKARRWIGDFANGCAGHRDIQNLARQVEAVIAQPATNRQQSLQSQPAIA